MPVKKIRPEYETQLEDWIAPIVAELDEAPNSGGADAPEIVEDYEAFSEKFSVRVIWSRWDGVPPSDRVPVILRAYETSTRAGDLPKITHVRGLSPTEADMEKIAEGFRETHEAHGRLAGMAVRRF